MQYSIIGYEPTITSAARRARAASARDAPPPERERAQWRSRVCAHAQAGCSLLGGAADTSEHGFAPKGRSFSLVQWPFIGHGPATTSAARRARRAALVVVRACPIRGHCTSERSILRCKAVLRRVSCGLLYSRLARVHTCNRNTALAISREETQHTRLPRASAVAQSRLRTRAGRLCGRPQLARRNTDLHRRREPSRWFSGLS